MPPVRKERVVTRTNSGAISRRSHGGRPKGSTRPTTPAGAPVEVPPQVDALSSQPNMANFDAKKLEDLITSGIAKGVEMGVAKALSMMGPPGGSPVAPAGSAVPPVVARESTVEVVAPVPPAQSTSPASSTAENAIVASSLPPQIPGRSGIDATSHANPLDYLVPQKVKDKIWAKEYIELSTLLNEEDQEMELQINSQSAKPTFTLVPKTRRTINTVARWVKAFNCYTAVYARKWPEEVPGLLKHAEIVMGLADDNANWRSYDKNFRKLHANGLEKYGQINVDLYLSSARTPFRGYSKWGDSGKDTKSPRENAKGKVRHPAGYCFVYHNDKKCFGCDFKHDCYQCEGRHPVSKCTKKSEAKRAKPHTGEKFTR